LEDESKKESSLAGRRRSIFNSLYYLLGIPAAVLAAVAGTTALASAADRTATAIIALCSSALSATLAFLDSAKQRDKWADRQRRWDNLYGDVRVTLDTYESTEHTSKSDRKTLKEFYKRRADIKAGRDPSANVGRSQIGIDADAGE
jgi:hypothetical protein